MIGRVAAIVRADFLIRFRRLSTAIVFLLLSGFAYVWVPAPSTGRALLRVGSARVINNSSAVSIGTAMLAALFIGLFGFYVISNAIGRDVRTRCGSIIGATGVKNFEYLAGKFAGNVVFLLAFAGGFMLVSMAMVVVRGEGPLEPLTFLRNYGLLVPATIVLVSAIAIVFEATPGLSGRGGDVAYFFVWVFLTSSAAAMLANDLGWAQAFDYQGFVLVMHELQRTFGAKGFSIGAGPFDASLAPKVLDGLHPTASALGMRFLATTWPVALLPIALLPFHRFDPSRVKARGKNGGRGWIARFDQLAKPLTRVVGVVRARGPLTADVVMTLSAHPIALVAVVVIIIVGTSTPQSLPIAFAAAGLFVSDVATRDRQAGAFALVCAAPGLRERYVAWKFTSSAVVVALLLAAPAARHIVSRPSALFPFVVAVLLSVAAAVSFGVISGNPKAFIVLFLSFWYLVANDRGATPALDFAALYVTPPATATLTYFAIALALLVAAEAVHRVRLRNA